MTNIEPLTAAEWQNVGGANEIARKLTLARSHVEDVLTGKRISCVVFGGSGMGKNRLVAEALEQFGPRGADGKLRLIYSNAATSDDLLKDFHRATYPHAEPLPIIMDEARNVFLTRAQLDIMKIATDTNPKAVRYWSNFTWTERIEYERLLKTGEIVMRSRFDTHNGTSLRAPIIAMTNIQLSDLEGKDVQAVRSRMGPIEIADDPYLSWEYTVFLALTTDIILRDRNGQTVSLVKRSQVIDWFTAHVWKLDQVSPRTLLQVFDAFLNAQPHLLDDELSLLLKPKDRWAHRQQPQQQNWSALRRNLTSTVPKSIAA